MTEPEEREELKKEKMIYLWKRQRKDITEEERIFYFSDIIYGKTLDGEIT